eukprot:5466319-Pleurochrysis_carterae.AAC.1
MTGSIPLGIVTNLCEVEPRVLHGSVTTAINHRFTFGCLRGRYICATFCPHGYQRVSSSLYKAAANRTVKSSAAPG